jgi:hypothetical protein
MSIRLGIRYSSYLVMALVAGFIVVVSQAFAPSTAAWIAFGAGVFFIVAGTVRMLDPGILHRLINGGIEVLGVLIVIETLLATGSTVEWLSFAGALAVLALSLIGLTVHELSTERVVHSLEVSSTRSNAKQPALS